MLSLDPAAAPALCVHGAVRRIDRRDVLAGATLRVERGSIVGLLGPNGAGKTSLLRAVTGRLRLDSGDIRIAGYTTGDARRRARLGVVPQDIALYDHLTVRENLWVLGRLAGIPNDALRGRVDAALRWAGLDDRADAFVPVLSGGMRRRVNLVAGTLHRPDLLLLDEPTVGIDASARARLHEMLRALRRDGMGLLMATHDADEAATLCDQVAVMAGGQVVAQDTPAALVAAAFDDRTEVSFHLATSPDAAARADLTAHGFEEAGDRQWVGRMRGSIADVAPLQDRIRARGLQFVETRVTEPHLSGAVALLLARHAREHGT